MKYKFLLTLILLTTTAFPAFSTQLPEPVITFVKEKYPEAKIRFDGLVELPDDTQYLPVMPVNDCKACDTVTIIQTIPAEQDFTDKPDMVLFSNDLALLKIIKSPDEPPTVTSSPEIPLKVKLGILPQDLVVPRGLVLSPDLKVLLGDLKIPLKERTDREEDIAFYEKTENDLVDNEKIADLVGKTTENVIKIPELEFLSGKKLYTINNKESKLLVLDPGSGRVHKTIDLPSIPLKMVITPDKRYILLTAPMAGKLFVVDSINDEFVKSIEIGKFPSSITCNTEEQKAYIANKLSQSISEIDLKNMVLKQTIPVTGYPDSLHASKNNDFLFYNDYRTGTIYQLNLNNKVAEKLYQDKNVVKIGQIGRYLLSLSRSEETLTIFDLKKNEISKKTKTSLKPVDFKVFENTGRILVVSAGANEINIISSEDFEVIKTVSLENNGFPGELELVESAGGKNKVLITDFDSYELTIYDIYKEKIDGYLPVTNIVGSMIVSDK